MTSPSADQPRTYGNWAARRSPGLFALGTLGTAVMFCGILLSLLAQASAGLVAAAVMASTTVLLLAPLTYRNRSGRNGWQILLNSVAWAAGSRRRRNVYQAPLASPVAFGEQRLPGLLAKTECLVAQTATGERFGLISIPATKHYAVVLAADPEGSQLVDQDTVDTWVAQHGRFLADMAHEPYLDAVSVTIETSPDSGAQLAREVGSFVQPGAPTLARAM